MLFLRLRSMFSQSCLSKESSFSASALTQAETEELQRLWLPAHRLLERMLTPLMIHAAPLLQRMKQQTYQKDI